MCFLIRMTRQGRRIAMSNPIWDWWFGDGSLAYMSVLRSTSRFTIRRRFIVFLTVIGVAHGAGSTLTWAGEGTIESKPNPVSIAWSPATSFATMLAAGGTLQTGQKQADAAIDTGAAAGNDRIPAPGLNVDDDQDRERRLQEMLNDSSTDDLAAEEQRDGEQARNSVDDDAALSAREIVTDSDDIAKELSAMPPLSTQDEQGNRNASAEYFIKPRYPRIDQGRFVLPPLRAVSIAEKSIGSGHVPKTVSAGDELNRIALPENGDQRVAHSGEGYWPELIRPWAAPNTFSHPLYFEDRMLERHGLERWGCFQPLASGTRFFTTLPMLPYLATVQPPCEFIYSKGYYRVGSPVPKFFQRPPLERRAIIVEAAAVSGAFIALP